MRAGMELWLGTYKGSSYYLPSFLWPFRGVAGVSWGDPVPILCKPFLSKQLTTGGENDMTIWWVALEILATPLAFILVLKVYNKQSFRKAGFHCRDHKVLDSSYNSLPIRKLHKYDVHTSSLKWFESYLCDHSQKCSIPHSSNLGAFLFSVYFNDLSSCWDYYWDIDVLMRINAKLCELRITR